MKAADLYRNGIEKLKSAGIVESDADAWELFSYVTGWDRAKYYAYMNDEPDGKAVIKYNELIELRCKHIPIQRITGEREFMGLDFFVNDCLIPRQDTEILVEEVLDYINSGAISGVKLLDLCTGTGCIPISIIKNTGACVQAVASDISPDALRTARLNAGRYAIPQDKLEFINSDIFLDIPVVRMNSFDIITSNPPYIPTGVIPSLSEEVREHDPYIALDGGEDGLHFYRRILPEAQIYLKRGGMLILEIGYDQGEALLKMMDEYGYENNRIVKDLSGLNRVVVGFRSRENSQYRSEM